MTQQYSGLSMETIEAAADRAARAIPPLWPLASSVAVNPYLGQTHEPLATAGARLARVGAGPITMPRAWFAEKVASGHITDTDITDAAMGTDIAVADVKVALQKPATKRTAQPTVADLAASATGVDWPSLITDRVSHWAAGYFDQGQALWAAPHRRTAYSAWRQNATHDLTPEIAGLPRFAQFVFETPDRTGAAALRAVRRLGLSAESLETYFHRLLVGLGGWAQVARYRLWQAELAGENDTTLTDLLTIRLLWEDALFAHCKDDITEAWADVIAEHAAPVAADTDMQVSAILQEAWERAGQRELAEIFALPAHAPAQSRPTLQAAFCIDVRSEVFRRAMEQADDGVQTLGFAGFFGLTPAHKGFASDVTENRYPVLINAGLSSTSSGDDPRADEAARLKARAVRAWGRFKLAAVSSFAFVEAMGPIFAGKLLRDTFHVPSKPTATEPAPQLEPALDLEGQINAANTILRAMSLTSDFARLVILAGHGAKVANNPFASGLQCGACGGYAGDVNARLLASVLNSAPVRAGLAEKGIHIPTDTVFVGALHNTTTDAMTLFTQDVAMPDHARDLAYAEGVFDKAGVLTRTERALRLPRAKSAGDVHLRSIDWSETRPEWALAGCRAFIAAPRSRTAGKPLGGRAFLHDYDWTADDGFSVLELIMTAPVVVASWISLQYYGSSVAPDSFGAGNKLLHNIIGGIGVLEGNGGQLRTGLPWQSVHDGSKYVHDPVRLSVCIEAPQEAITDILSRHENVRALFDNKWLHLFALNADGQMAARYAGDLAWSEVPEMALPSLARAS